MEETITINQAYEIFNQRRIDLEQFKEINPDEIVSSEERSIIIFSKKTYELNERLCKLFKGKLS